MKDGIVFEIGTTDFDETIKICELAFRECNTEDWNEVKESKDFHALSDFLKTHDINNKTFKLT